MQYSSAVTGGLGDTPTEVLGALLSAHGDDVGTSGASDGGLVEQRTWRLMRRLEGECPPEIFDGWKGLWEGVVAVLDPQVRLDVTSRLDMGDDAFRWRLTRRRPPTRF